MVVRKLHGRLSFLRLQLDQSHTGARLFGPSAGVIASSSAQEHSILDIGVESHPENPLSTQLQGHFRNRLPLSKDSFERVFR